MHQETRATLFALAAIAMWSTVATAFKIGLTHNSLVPLLGIASLTSLLIFSLNLAWQKRLGAAAHGLAKHWRYSLLLAAINPTSYYLILFSAYDRLPAQVAQPINFTWAIVLSVMSAVWLKQTLTRWELAGLLGGYAGVAVITTAGFQVTGQLSWVGLGLVVVSTFLWASFWLLNTRSEQAADIQLWQNFVLATPSVLALALVTGAEFHWHWQALASAAYIGVFEMGLAFLFWQRALMLTQHTTRISTLIFLSPIVSLFLISAVLAEPLQLRTFVGLAMIVLGVWLSQRKPTQI